MFKRLLCILLACLMATTPVYAGSGEKLGKKQKSKEQAEIEKAEKEEKIQIEEEGVGPVNVQFKHGKYSLKPSKETSKRGQQESSRTNYCIVADIRYGKMAIFVYRGGRKRRTLIKKAACSSAKDIKGTKTSSTPGGHKTISWKTNRLVYKNKDGRRWQYWSCSMTSGGWGIHSLTYATKANKYQRKYLWGGKLGAHNSPMCLRTENWLADWIYYNVPTGTTLYVIR